MTRAILARAAGLLFAAALLLPAAAQAQPVGVAAATPRPFTIGYVELTDDARYNDDYAYARIQLRALGRPFVGAQMGINDAEFTMDVLGIDLSLERVQGDSVDALATAVTDWVAQGTHFVLADLPADALLALADRVRNLDVTLINTTAPEDSLRGASCRANVVHTIPSYAMQTDAMVQYLVQQQWPNILVLQGPLPEDAELVAALRRSVQKFGARIVAVRPFMLTADPRERDQSNVPLLTTGSYDVVYVADTDGEFARYVPYATQLPRPVVGTVGLVADAWQWTWERNGGPQVNSRFETLAGRVMTGYDWSAWVAVRLITQALLRTNSTDFATVRDYVLGPQMNLDGSKGNPLSVRPWDHQLRQPMFVSTFNAVIARPPLDGFLHQFNELDTLGVDQPETACRF